MPDLLLQPSGGWMRGAFSLVLILGSASCGRGGGSSGDPDVAAGVDASDASTRMETSGGKEGVLETDGSRGMDVSAEADGVRGDLCVPNCDGVRCGDDGCGGPCACPAHLACDEPTGRCRTEATALAPMRDKVRLSTHVLLPSKGDGPWPTLLLRTPYGLLIPEGYLFEPFRPFTDDGYALVIQLCRGTSDSEGRLSPLSQEFDDGHDAVGWVTSQPWSNGKVGTLGASYEAFTALAAAIDTPEVKVVIADGTPARAFRGWPGQRGLFNSLLWWLHLVKTGEDLLSDPKYVSAVTNTRPFADLDRILFNETYPIWRATLPHMDRESGFWADWGLSRSRLKKLCAPVLHLQAAGEWEDDVLQGFLDILSDPCSAEVREAQRYVLGSHQHGEAVYSPFESSRTGDLIRRYLARHLKGEEVDLSGVPPVQYYLQKADEWRSAPEWPPSTEVLDLFLGAPTRAAGLGTLSESPPGADATDTYTFDPALDDACNQALVPGSVLYEAEPLTAPLDLVGRVEAVLNVVVDVPDTDLFVYLFEVTPKQDWQSIQGSRLRLRFRDSYADPTPMPLGEPVEVSVLLPATAWRVSTGSRLALYVTSSECGFAENPSTGGDITSETETQIAHITILSGPSRRSRIRLPYTKPAPSAPP